VGVDPDIMKRHAVFPELGVPVRQSMLDYLESLCDSARWSFLGSFQNRLTRIRRCLLELSADAMMKSFLRPA